LNPDISVEPVPYKTLWELFNPEKGGPNNKWEGDELHSEDHYKLFIDLLDQILNYNPEIRIKPLEALNHPFFYKYLGTLSFPNIILKQHADNIKLCLSSPLPDPQDNNLLPDVGYICRKILSNKRIMSNTRFSSTSTKESRKMTVIKKILSIPSHLGSSQELGTKAKEHPMTGSNKNSGTSKDESEETKFNNKREAPPWPCKGMFNLNVIVDMHAIENPIQFIMRSQKNSSLNTCKQESLVSCTPAIILSQTSIFYE